MIYQEYLLSDSSNVVLVYNIPEEFDEIALLVPGFLECSCDKSYFYTRLSNMLNSINIMTVQLEPFAHGYSYGDTLDFTMEKVKNNIVDALIMLKERYQKKMNLIANGLYSSLINDASIINICEKYICINPTCICEDDFNSISTIKSDTFELADYILNDEKILDIFLRMGASPRNICSQLFRKENLINMLLYSMESQKKTNDNAYYIYSDYESNELYLTKTMIVDNKNYFSAFSDPMLIYKMCLLIINILEVKDESSI